MDILSNFGETLSELMLMHNLKVKELAEATNIDRSSFSNYLGKKVIPTIQYATAIANYFGCSLDYLFGLSNEYMKKEYLSCPPFYQAFQETLKMHNCTKYRLSKDLGYANQSLIAWFRGDYIPTIDNLIIMAEYFNCTLDELVGRKAVE